MKTEKEKEYDRKYYQEHKDEIKKYHAEYYKKNKEKLLVQFKEYNKNNPEKNKEYDKKFRETHKDEIREYSKNYIIKNRDRSKARRRKLKLEAFKKISLFHNTTIKCWRCGTENIFVLTIGHINDDGHIDRKKYDTVSFYKVIVDEKRTCEDLQLECANCNLCKGWYGNYPDEITKDFLDQ